MIMLCVLIYVRTGCGLRTVVEVLNIFEEVIGEIGKAPAYTTVRTWVLRLGLAVYNETLPKGKKYAIIFDESIMVNKEKLLLTLGIPAEHQGRPVKHGDVTVLGLQVGHKFDGAAVAGEIDRISQEMGDQPEYAISDEGHNLINGGSRTDVPHHHDISHAMANCMKKVYGNDPMFKELTEKLGKIRLQYHLTDKAWLLAPNMRSICRFMNLEVWVDWGVRMLRCLNSLEDDMKTAYSFLLDYSDFLAELNICAKAIRHVEDVCKNKGYSIETDEECRHYIIRNVIGNANNRRAALGLRMLDYFDRERKLLCGPDCVRNISSDIIESDFGILKAKQSPNKNYGMTSLVLMMPLYPKVVDYNVAEIQDFKVRLANVKLKDVDAWAKEHLSQNWVAKRSKTLRNAG